ncbi:4-nitrocatechol monooxygenase [Burkholderia stabilis]|uniref:Rieske (2Fe-2S) protein n=1 Tax=Burkholderia stabilis TaxID=95485 RepID=UPI000852124B|nr:Rieske 2Fe-2S domain-containing protein [Burkholderia stabilis]AOR71654.1 4-nitrocatechol monooxygenase [Burkholderia stabilis]HDR9491615.1 Rieske 2Fe-2S domain-containing protein [Burkholderia stabilis]HDR9522236.1 Rieske 2Fe-2S domain-containing protein [Burkholderia stabilis]HDR9529485.1 Rieske 2Fe-2S domain-containing protein [Burkholderia stabilis]HDR9539066.1 Rieske 2Fe-2S domain-containing protein [Burkholderia stabilis]
MDARQLCRFSEVPDGGARVVDEACIGRPVIVVRRGEQVWAYVNRCPHFSVPLDFEPGSVSCYRSQVLMCAHHSALFRFDDGVCIDGPCSGSALEAVAVEVDSTAWIVCRSA